MDCTSDQQPSQQQQQQPLTIEIATAEFRAGVTACLKSWSALRTAVEKGWGGSQSKEKAEFLRNHIYENFDYAKKNSKPGMDVYDLEDALAIYMEEEYSIVLEEDSERQIAHLIMNMYEQCGQGDFSLSRRTIQAAIEGNKSDNGIGGGNSNTAIVQSNGELDEDSDDDMMDGGAGAGAGAVQQSSAMNTNANANVTTTFTNAEEYAADWLFGAPPGQERRSNDNRPPPRQLGEAAAPKPEPEIDDDGFMTVKRR